MKLITVNPDDRYFTWQLLVQSHNFRRMGIEDDAVRVVVNNGNSKPTPNSIENMGIGASCIFIKDTRGDEGLTYPPSVVPHAMKKLVRDGLVDHQHESYLLHDADIIFREVPRFDTLSRKRNVQLSDTVSYVGAKSIKSNSPKLFHDMCDIVGIPPRFVERKETKSGGAQYFIPAGTALSYEFWDKVERDCYDLFDVIVRSYRNNDAENSRGVQSWTASMWALLWNLWLEGIGTEINDELSFAWTGTPISNWDKHKIYHQAGYGEPSPIYFHKEKYVDEWPFTDDFDKISYKYCSFKYAQEVIETAKELGIRKG